MFLANWADWNDPQIQGNVRNIQEYYNILASPNADQDLPQVVFIERASATGLDEHPDNNVQTGAARCAADHQRAADQRGLAGFGVHPDLRRRRRTVRPRGADPGHAAGRYDCRVDLQGHTQGLFNVTGFRVPVIVVSPWVKPHTVSHLPTDYTAMLKLIETRFNVPALTQRDATAGDMADPTNGFFDFSSPHLLPVPPLPTQPTNGTCDQQLEGSSVEASRGKSAQRKRPPRTAIAEALFFGQKKSEATCLAEAQLLLFLLGGLLRGLLLRCHWVIPPYGTFSLEGLELSLAQNTILPKILHEQYV